MDHQRRVDRCLLHALKSIGFGVAMGLAASTLIFKRKRWPFILGTGYGIGSAIAGCDVELFHKQYLDPCEEAKRKKDDKEAKKKKEDDEKKDDKKDAPKNLENKGGERPKDLNQDNKIPPPPGEHLDNTSDKARKPADEKKGKKL